MYYRADNAPAGRLDLRTNGGTPNLGELHMSRAHRRPAVVGLIAAALLVASAPAVPIQADESVEIQAQEVVHDLSGEQVVIDLPLDAASHVALHWPGQHEALV